ncbi:MAG: DPP IV N-terminal domain-containing protein [Bdellovibrionales bacterium]
MIKYLILFLICAVSSQSIANDKIFIKLGQGKVAKSPMAVPPLQFFGNPNIQKDYSRIGSEMYRTLLNNLDVSYLFRFISQSSYLEDPMKTSLRPKPFDRNGFDFSNWKKIGTEFMIRGGFKFIGNDVELETYLYHVTTGETLLSKKYRGPKSGGRAIAHKLSNDIIYRLTGKKGIFNTRVVVSSDRDSGCRKGQTKCNRIKEIYLMDWDGRNMQRITKHKSISISPAISPDGKTVAYTSFAYHPKMKMRNPDLFSYEVDTGKRYLLSYEKGVNSGAAFSPDGKHIFLTMSKKGNSDIYRMNKDGTKKIQLTRGPFGALNVEPAISNDGKKIAFSSDRHGSPKIYTMDINGKNVKSVTPRAGRYNSTPSWSPDGKHIVFAGEDKGAFDIFLVTADGLKIERLTSAKKANGKRANNEDPSFSPDGRHIVFVSDRTGSRQVYIIGVDGQNERRITVDHHNYFKPKWSKYLD